MVEHLRTEYRMYRVAADLYWIAFLITGCAERSADIVVNQVENCSTFSLSNLPLVRRAVLSEAAAAVQCELALSAARLEHVQADQPSLPPLAWSLDPNTSKIQVQKALLAIAIFPRCALLLTVFEHLQINDAAALLKTDSVLVMRGRLVGLFELTRNLASLQVWRYEGANTRDTERETPYT